ncbi:MAG TPA: ankyrin repeat domain-containing protein [Leptospiraceae bacterium]|nr:ankyrin repeat domain-containing protein [Leptospiraceae bacterium]
MKKIYVLDTNVFIENPFILDIFYKDELIIVSSKVIEELDNLKNNPKERVRDNSKQAILNIKRYEDENLEFSHSHSELLHGDYDKKSPDNLILSVAIKYNSENTILLTQDNNLHLKAKLEKIKVLNLVKFYEIKNNSLNLSEAQILKNERFLKCCKSGNIDGAKDVLNMGIDINYTDTKGLTPLIYAVKNEDIKMLNFLLKLNGIDINKRDNFKLKNPPILYAAQKGNVQVIELLHTHGANLNSASEGKNKGNTALLIAAWDGHNELVKYLLKNNVNINQVDNNGYTALIKACIKNNFSLIQLLIQHKANPFIKDRQNRMAISYLSDSNSEKFLKIYMEEYNGRSV